MKQIKKSLIDVDKKKPGVAGLVTTIALNTNTIGLVTTTINNTKIGEVEEKMLDVSGLFKTFFGLFMMLKYQTLKQNIILLLIIINSQKKYLMHR